MIGHRTRNFLVAASATALLCAAWSAQAQQSPTTIDPKDLTLPNSAAPNAASPADKDDAAKFKMPSIDLGKGALQFDAGKTSDVNPRTGFDSGEMSKVTPGKNDNPTPDYFGLKLKVPTNN